MKKQDTKWIKPRHLVIQYVLSVLLYPYCRLRYGIKAEKFKEQRRRPYLILYNHQTAFDQFFVGFSFRKPIYYMATEDIFSMGWVSSLIRWLVAPIPIKKQTTDLVAVKNCIRVAREGGTIAIAPEGNRTYSGKTVYINPAIASLARKLGMPIALYHIEGGYGAQPRWSDVIRRGRMRSYVSEVIEPEEYAALTNDQLLERIEQGLYVNEAVADGTFHHRKRAEYLERAIYTCPFCGPAKWESRGAVCTCTACGRQVTYEPTKEIKGVGFDFPFPFVADWYAHQEGVVNALNPADYTASPLFRDTAALWDVQPNRNKTCLRESSAVALYGDRIAIDAEGANPLILPFDKITAAAVLGRNKLNVYHDGNVYQFRGDKRFNALKYVHLYHRYKNVSKGEPYGQFLGL